MKRAFFAIVLSAPNLVFAQLPIDQGKNLINDLISAQQTCNSARIDDSDSQKSCDKAQDIEMQLFSGGWCFVDSKNTYNPCEPEYLKFSQNNKKGKKPQKLETIFSYTTTQYHIGQIAKTDGLLYRYYPERRCELPLANAKNMRYMVRYVPGLGSFSGCYWRTIDAKVVSLFMDRGQAQYDTFPEYSILTMRLSPDQSEAMVTGHLMSMSEMRRITMGN
ncbi:hypothetical protein [Burkholderia gladioli]|uniref:hypothetical protein n=1 Tax=Burkholderia gladioli TaxID=28095 RepID=UPI00164219BB|nr:hypothetical protein [Burkholderia gladioli]